MAAVEAALIEPLAVCLHGMRRLHLEDKSSAVVFGDGPIGVRQGHLPATEIHEPGTEFEVLGMQRGVFECHPANLAVASGRYFPSKLKTSRR